jgi:ATP-binding cassette subfamily B (MDR/TAP) protein 1
MIHVLGTFIGGFVVAFVTGWLMTLVCLAAFPIIAYAGFLYMRSLQSKSSEFQKYYSKAGGLSEQAFYSIKTVKQLNGEAHEEKIYEDCLDEVRTNSIKFGAKIAASMAFMSSAMFLLYSLGYWFGSNCADPNSSSCPTSVSGKLYSAGDVITVFFAVLVGCFNLSQLSPALKKIGEGQ